MRDAIKFVGWFSLFFGLLSLRSVALSPDTPTSYDSSSIYHREEAVDAAPAEPVDSAPSPTEPAAETPAPTASDTPVLPSESAETVSVYYRPDTARATRSLTESLRLNYASEAFEPKIVPLSLVYDADRAEPRGQVSGRTLTLSLSIPTVDESLAVFVHELGHVVDIQHLRRGSLSADPSKRFYALSWRSSSEKLPEAAIADFVSGYALSNQYEDFAETFAFYVLHNDTFRRRAESNPVLRAKYEFMRDEVFPDRLFDGTDFGVGTVEPYFWDTTKIAFDRKKYLFFIR